MQTYQDRQRVGQAPAAQPESESAYMPRSVSQDGWSAPGPVGASPLSASAVPASAAGPMQASKKERRARTAAQQSARDIESQEQEDNRIYAAARGRFLQSEAGRGFSDEDVYNYFFNGNSSLESRGHFLQLQLPGLDSEAEQDRMFAAMASGIGGRQEDTAGIAGYFGQFMDRVDNTDFSSLAASRDADVFAAQARHNRTLQSLNYVSTVLGDEAMRGAIQRSRGMGDEEFAQSVQNQRNLSAANADASYLASQTLNPSEREMLEGSAFSMDSIRARNAQRRRRALSQWPGLS